MYQKEVDAVLKELNTSDKGLTAHQAESRLHKYGLNELTAKEGIHPLKIIFEQFSSPLVWILLVAFAFSLYEHAFIDAVVIGVIIILNAVLGFVQEYRAERAIEALQKLASLKAKVLRSGKLIKIDSKYIVPGDIIILETGDKVPADCRLFEIHNLETQEGPLTGESLPVAKNLTILKEKTPLADRKNMVYASTIISKGRGKAIVAHTGMSSQIGKIAKLIQEAQQQSTPLQKKLRELGKYLTIAVIIIAIIVFLAGILSGKPASLMLLTAIALAVAAIPEGLPAVITISLAMGVQKMIKRNALVRKLPSVETLGSVSVICTDKTGTLTHNEMTVTKIWTNNQIYNVTGSGYHPEGKFTIGDKLANPEPLETILTCGALCNDASIKKKNNRYEVFGDPTEAALIVSAQKAGLKIKNSRIDEIQFSSERKMMTTFHKTKDGTVSYTKGAPDIIINLCDRILINGKVIRLTRELKKSILDQNEEFAKQALRVLGFAYNTKKNAEQGMIFIGLQAMIDPPRQEVKQAIQRCHDAGIRVIMITGDHLTTAKAIAAELGITGRAITGQEMNKKINDVNIFARVNPEHKLRIVENLKKSGYVVAMTGDGVNDAPALKKADIGISMGLSGTDVAKEASDMILTDDNFTSIVNAVEEGRGIFDNIRKFVNYLLSSNLGEITVILFAAIYSAVFDLHLGLPLTAIQILWINLITDGLPATALALDPHSPGIMQRKPRPASESILSKSLIRFILVFGILMGTISLIIFILYSNSAKAQTMVFTSLVVFELVRLQVIRSEYKLSMFSNKPLVVAVIFSILLQIITIYTPLNKFFKTVPLELVDWGVLILATILLLVIYKISAKIKPIKD